MLSSHHKIKNLYILISSLLLDIFSIQTTVECALEIPQLKPGTSVVLKEADTLQQLYNEPLPDKQHDYYLTQVQDLVNGKFQLVVGRYSSNKYNKQEAFVPQTKDAIARSLLQSENITRADFSNSDSGFETVLGKDGRRLVENTTSYPYSAIARIAYNCPAEDLAELICSGTMITKNVMLTAAHCVSQTYSELELCSTSNYTVVPGYYEIDGEPQTPFGKYTPSKILVAPGWDKENNAWKSHDMALLTFKEPIGRFTGWLQYGIDCFELSYDEMVTAGYPVDRTNTVKELRFDGSQMVTTTCDVNLDACANDKAFGEFGHQCDTAGGQSGSPMWIFIEGDQPKREVRAVHVRGIGESIRGLEDDELDTKFNKAIYISEDAYFWLVANRL
eukprot:TRINITY_DN4551_c0_g2_i2.p1 TRINITY_DN4551_c0_g2~~TRINITY_DN4551_c0_g2_i2.p1  ORF type:complete len:389 (-),score=37.79 TRINITY_DN4551_c0_g2_i2:276-1442(-)